MFTRAADTLPATLCEALYAAELADAGLWKVNPCTHGLSLGLQPRGARHEERLRSSPIASMASTVSLHCSSDFAPVYLSFPIFLYVFAVVGKTVLKRVRPSRTGTTDDQLKRAGGDGRPEQEQRADGRVVEGRKRVSQSWRRARLALRMQTSA